MQAYPMMPPMMGPTTTDYNHMSVPTTADGATEEGGTAQEWEVTSDNWFDYHPTAGQEFYNGGWAAEGMGMLILRNSCYQPQLVLRAVNQQTLQTFGP